MDDNLLNEIERRVQEVISTSLDTANRIDKDHSRIWTFELKKSLTALGRELGYKVRGAEPDRRDYFEAGWLWDLCWVEVRDRTLIHLPLIVESEWNTDFENEILWWDFQKLIVGQAALRVMVFGASQPESAFDRLIDAVRQHAVSKPGDRYLLAAWDYRTKAPRFRSFRVPSP